MAQLLESKHARLAATLDGNYPQLQSTVWQAEDTVQSAVQTLSPQMSENKLKARNFHPQTIQQAVRCPDFVATDVRQQTQGTHFRPSDNTHVARVHSAAHGIGVDCGILKKTSQEEYRTNQDDAEPHSCCLRAGQVTRESRRICPREDLLVRVWGSRYLQQQIPADAGGRPTEGDDGDARGTAG